jgi:hypothetical protein
LSAIKDFENGNRRTLPSIRLQLQAALDRAGVIFLLNGLEVEEPSQLVGAATDRLPPPQKER